MSKFVLLNENGFETNKNLTAIPEVSNLTSSSVISNSASRSTIHQGESVFAVRAKFTSLDRWLEMTLVAKPCWVVELCQAGLFVATSVPSEIVGKGYVSSRVCMSPSFCLWCLTCFPSDYHNTLPPSMPLPYYINTQPYFHPTAVLPPIWDQFPYLVKLVDLGIGDPPTPHGLVVK